MKIGTILAVLATAAAVLAIAIAAPARAFAAPAHPQPRAAAACAAACLHERERDAADRGIGSSAWLLMLGGFLGLGAMLRAARTGMVD